MEKYLALYKKELRSIYGMVVFIVVASVSVTAVFFIRNLCAEFAYYQMRSLRFLWRPLNQFRYAIVFIFPVILAYLLNIERISKTHYLALSQPVPRYTIMLCKFLTVISIGALLVFLLQFMEKVIENAVIRTLGQWNYFKSNPQAIKLLKDHNRYHLIEPYLSFPYRIILKRFFGTAGIFCFFHKVFWIEFLRKILRIIMYSSIVCIAQGTMMTVKRHRLLIWVLTFGGCLSLYAFTDGRLRYMGEIYSIYTRYNFYMILLLLFGFIFLLTGLFLYEKYTEV